MLAEHKEQIRINRQNIYSDSRSPRSRMGTNSVKYEQEGSQASNLVDLGRRKSPSRQAEITKIVSNNLYQKTQDEIRAVS
jgi:hypothetical protein